MKYLKSICDERKMWYELSQILRNVSNQAEADSGILIFGAYNM